MDSEARASKLKPFLTKYQITHNKTNERPWGSYDLVMQIPANPGHLITNMTFGWGYTTEDAAAIALYRYVTATTQNPHLPAWLGQTVYDELTQLCKDIDKLEELRQEVVLELPTGSME